MNPLFASDDDDKKKQGTGYVLPNRHGRKITPLHDNITAETAHPAHPAHHSQSHHLNSNATAHFAGSPTGAMPTDKDNNPAVDLIRRKLETLYADDPMTGTSNDNSVKSAAVAPAQQPAQVIQAQDTLASVEGRTKHQQFMHDLSASGKSLAEIQTAWHEYYSKLPDDEKHAVWQEFYATNNRQPSAYTQFTAVQHAARPHVVETKPDHYNHADTTPRAAVPAFPPIRKKRSHHHEAAKEQDHKDKPVVVAGYEQSRTKKEKVDKPAVKALKKQIKKHVNLSTAQQAKAKQHAKSLFFGLSSGAVVLLVVLFGLFNEVVLAPFIQPSRQASATPIILGTDSVAPSATPEVIIPKTSVQIPVDYTMTTSDEETFQKALESAVVHYHTTSKPGEKGNTAIFGHSSNNIFNPGKYKFAFVKLHELVPGDIFYLTYNQKVYSYRVYDKRIVPPTDVSVLDAVPDKTATATLITCDPPGTSLNRLVVWGEQISPDPNGNVDAAVPTDETTPQPTQITGNGPSLWKRITGWFQ